MPRTWPCEAQAGARRPGAPGDRLTSAWQARVRLGATDGRHRHGTSASLARPTPPAATRSRAGTAPRLLPRQPSRVPWGSARQRRRVPGRPCHQRNQREAPGHDSSASRCRSSRGVPGDGNEPARARHDSQAMPGASPTRQLSRLASVSPIAARRQTLTRPRQALPPGPSPRGPAGVTAIVSRAGRLSLALLPGQASGPTTSNARGCRNGCRSCCQSCCQGCC